MTAPPDAPPRIRHAADVAALNSSRTDPDRFVALFDTYYPEIHRYARARLDADMAEDVASETFLIAFRQRGTFDESVGSGQVRSWLYGIATNLIRRHHRSERRRYRAMAASAESLVDPGHDERVADRLNAQRIRGDLAAALAALPARDPSGSPVDKSGRTWRLVDQWVAVKGTSRAGVLTYQNGKAVGEPRLEEFFSGWGAEAEFSMVEVERLPADPAGMRAALTKKAKKLGIDLAHLTSDGVEGYLFEATVGLLARAPLSPAQRSAAYRLLATLPRVETTGTATDSRGRAGMSITYQGTTQTTKVIIDQTTYVILATLTQLKPRTPAATLTDGRKPPTVPAEQTMRRMPTEMLFTIRGWTDQEPTLPTVP